MQTFLFYDIETTGLSKSFDQVLHFAAIRTDVDLKELNRYEFKIKINIDCIPSAYALKTHQISIKSTSEAISEIDAIKQIHSLMNQAGTVSVGYNSLGFDDEFLRFSFYRNLLPAYTHQYANQCGRMDLYPIAVMYFLFKNSILKWPKKNNKTSLKLEELNNTNQFIHGRAHDAMVDVEVTLALARVFFQEREMWDYLIAFFNKQTDQKRLQALKDQEGLMIDGIFGADQYYQCPVLLLGNHRHYKNQSLWLKLDSNTLSQTTAETISETTWGVRKKPGEPGFILPLQDRFLQYMSPERSCLVASNKKWLQRNSELFNKIVNYHLEYCYPNYPETDIEASLYLNGFWFPVEENFCREFHQANPYDKALLTSKVKNPTLKMLAIRLLGRHFPDAMTPAQSEQFNQYLEKINPDNEENTLIDFRGQKRLTPKTTLNDIDILRKEKDMTTYQLELLNELESYLKIKFKLCDNANYG